MNYLFCRRVGLILILCILLPLTSGGAGLAMEQLANTNGSIVYLPMITMNYQYIPPPDDMVYIPAGEFQMGCDPAHNDGYSCGPGELPLHTVYLDDFYMDKYEVTNAKYAQCVAAGNCAPPAFNSSETRPLYYGNPTYAEYPVVYVKWNQANAYCTWVGGRLPTEAEWEKAAQGTTARAYPWGDQSPDCTLANYEGCVGDTSEVGIYPDGASPYGVLDMAGNVWEWVADWYDEDYYSISPSSNPTGPATGEFRVLRSGEFNGHVSLLRTARRASNIPTFPYSDVGFRCTVLP